MDEAEGEAEEEEAVAASSSEGRRGTDILPQDTWTATQWLALIVVTNAVCKNSLMISVSAFHVC